MRYRDGDFRHFVIVKKIVMRLVLALFAAALVLVGASSLGASSAVAAPTAPEALIQALGNEATAIAQDASLGDDGRTERFRGILAKNMDTEAMAQVALGRFWAKATDAERQAYVAAYREYLIRVYGRRLRDLGQSRVEVAGSRAVGPGDTVVDTRLISGPDAFPISFRVLERNGANLIIDVLAEGTSILVTQREEFAAVVKATGGIAGLTAKLQSIQ